MPRFSLLLLCSAFLFQNAMSQKKDFAGVLKEDAQLVSDFKGSVYAFIDSAIAMKRIVFLGEATHQDGSALKLKSNLIRYLVERQNFQVVLFETNLFEMDAFSKLSREGLNNGILSKTAFGVNGEYSKETVELVDYLVSLNSIEIGGFDVGYNSWLGNLLKASILKIFKEKGILTKSISKSIELYIDYLNSYIINYQFDVGHKAEFPVEEFQRLSDDIIKCLKNYSDDASVESLSQVIRSNLILVHWIRERQQITNPKDISQYSKLHEIREVGMAANLSWLVTNKFKDKKIIVSTSTYHMTTAMDGLKPMRSYLPIEIINSAVFYPIIWYERHEDLSATKNSTRRPEQSLEYFLSLSGVQKGFVDFHSLKLMPYLDTLDVTFSDALPKKAAWSKIYDGAFYFKDMEMTKKGVLTPTELDYFQRQLLKKVR